MRDPIENITLLQRQINELQIENQLLKNLLSQNGVSYEKSLLQLKTDEHVEEYELNQGKRIIHPDKITDEMANLFLLGFGVGRMYMLKEVLIRRLARLVIILNVKIFGVINVILGLKQELNVKIVITMFMTR